eukprot:9034896-Ditylum_brightwellii.AAC.1
MARFPAPGNNLMADDELCDILYQMFKHDWRDALLKSGRNPRDMNLQDLTDYFKQIKLLKASAHQECKVKANAKSKLPDKDKRKICVLCQQFGGNPNHHTAKDCYRHKLTKKLKKYKEQKGK